MNAVFHYGSLHVVPPGEDVTLYMFALYMVSDRCANAFNLSKERYFFHTCSGVVPSLRYQLS